MSRPAGGILLLHLASAWLVAGCRTGPLVRHDRPAETVLVVDSATRARNAMREPGVLGTVEGVPVEGWTGPGHRMFEVARRTAAPDAGHARQFGTVMLSIGLRDRAAGLTQYPCTACHLGRRVVMENRRIADAHQNIQPVHPAQTGAVCSTCHAPENVGLLLLLNGRRVGLDESYRLCAECHFAQVSAWAGGGHGKRLDGWQGRRVVMACPDCHDPHRPALQPRIPFRAPRLARARNEDRP